MTPDQEKELCAQATAAGLDADAVLAAAKRLENADTSSAPSAEQPKLFQYHLPFVTVREVRSTWLGLTDPFPGDSEVAAVWAAKNGGGGGTPPPAAPA